MIGQMGINGDVESKMDAYRGNPQALMQRYAQSQELVDLLALQKLKSEKESATRDMQMKMDAAGMPTVAQQREQEVLDLTKKEVAQQAGIGGQQQAAQQQQAMQKLMQAAGAPQGAGAAPPTPPQAQGGAGIAGLPTPGMMTPKAMATGGIVAFAAGDQVPDPEEERRRELERSGMGSIAERGIRELMAYSPERLREERTRGAQEAFGLTPEERAQRERQMQETARLDESQLSPERQRREGLTQWLLGAANRSGMGSTLAGAGAAATNYRSEMDQTTRQRMLERQKQETDLSNIDREARAGAFEAGVTGEKTGLEALLGGTRTAGGLQEAMLRASSTGSDPAAAYRKGQQVLASNPSYAAMLTEEKAAQKYLQDLGESGAGPAGNAVRTKLADVVRRREQMEEAYFRQQDPVALAGLQMMRRAREQSEQPATAPPGGEQGFKLLGVE